MTTKLASYKYDDLGRLVHVAFPSGASSSFSYDAAGNRLVTAEIPASVTPGSAVAVDSFAKKNTGDMVNAAMLVKLTSGELIGWGDNTNGILADGIATATNQPPQRILFDPNTPMPPFDAIIVDWTFTNANLYVVYSNGWVYSSGQNAYGQLGTGEALTIVRPYLKLIEAFVTGGKKVTNVWASGSHGTTDGAGCVYFQTQDRLMYGCGINTAGNLGVGGIVNQTTPALITIAGLDPARYVTEVHIACPINLFSTYMLMDDFSLYVAGYNLQGQLGVGTVANVTTGFTPALTTAGNASFKSLSVNGGAAGTSPGGNALGIDSSGNVWTVGYNGHGELGLGTTVSVNKFTKITTTGISNIAKAQLGCGYYGVGYAIDAAGAFYTWGYNGQNNLFKNNTTTPSLPSQATFVPGIVSKCFFPKGNYLNTSVQLFVLTTSGRISYCGNDNGQLPIADAANPNSFYIVLPRVILDGTETIVDIFPQGSAALQRIFLLTDKGNLYACGNNTDSVCTGGFSSNVIAAAVSCFKLNIVQFDN
jgi:YD repeat-containing protein